MQRALRLGGGRHRLARAGGRRPRRAVRQRRPERAARRAVDRSRAGRQARPLREAARPRRRRVAPDVGEAATRAGVHAHVRLQLPLRPRRPARPRDRRGRRHRRRSSTSAPRYLQSWGWDADDGHLALRPRAGRAPARSAISARTSSTSRATSSARSTSCRRLVRTFVPGREVDDAFVATVEFANGAIGTLEASRLARGPRQPQHLRDQRLEGLDRLRPRALRTSCSGRRRAGVRVLVTEPSTVIGDWWPPGHIVGWGDTFTLEYRAPARARSRARAPSRRTARRSRTATAPRGLRRDPALVGRAGRPKRITYRGSDE